MSRSMTKALEALTAGDLPALSRLFDADPRLVYERWSSPDVPYNGYFYRATLLHHVSGNPLVDPVPSNAVALAALLIERGAEVDAVTDQGPSQPDDVGWTTLGLVATSAAARAAGVQADLMQFLVEAGADVDARNGGGLMGALYYGEAEAAARLVELGADVDFVAAAGLGRLDLMEPWIDPEGVLREGAHHLVHYSQVPLPERETIDDLLGIALCYAVKTGHLDAARRLLELGAEVDAQPPFDHRATPLHWAVIGDEPPAIRWLLEQGANPSLCDETHGSTARSWARALDRPDVEAAFGQARE